MIVDLCSCLDDFLKGQLNFARLSRILMPKVYLRRIFRNLIRNLKVFKSGLSISLSCSSMGTFYHFNWNSDFFWYVISLMEENTQRFGEILLARNRGWSSISKMKWGYLKQFLINMWWKQKYLISWKELAYLATKGCCLPNLNGITRVCNK